MRISNKSIGWVVALGFWAGALSLPILSPVVPQAPTGNNPLAICGSPYGSLIARLMKESIHNYWHAGRSEHAHELQGMTNKGGNPEEVISGVGAGLDRLSHWISEMEEVRQAPPKAHKISPAHQRYLDASANWHVSVASRLDPGDASLYEIMHFTVMSKASSPDGARRVSQALAEQTIRFGLHAQSSLAAALTGAGAAVNLLNNDLAPGLSAKVENNEMLQHWAWLGECIARYRELRRNAERMGWWEELPPVRRTEIGSYAKLIEKLSESIERKLTIMGVLKAQELPTLSQASVDFEEEGTGFR